MTLDKLRAMNLSVVADEIERLLAENEQLRAACQLAYQTPLDEYYSRGVNVALHKALHGSGPDGLKDEQCPQ